MQPTRSNPSGTPLMNLGCAARCAKIIPIIFVRSVAIPSTRSVPSGADAGGKAALIASCTGVGIHTSAATCSDLTLAACATPPADTAVSSPAGQCTRWWKIRTERKGSRVPPNPRHPGLPMSTRCRTAGRVFQAPSTRLPIVRGPGLSKRSCSPASRLFRYPGRP